MKRVRRSKFLRAGDESTLLIGTHSEAVDE
jgi:hypothetical protein